MIDLSTMTMCEWLIHWVEAIFDYFQMLIHLVYLSYRFRLFTKDYHPNIYWHPNRKRSYYLVYQNLSSCFVLLQDYIWIINFHLFNQWIYNYNRCICFIDVLRNILHPLKHSFIDSIHIIHEWEQVLIHHPIQ